MQKSVRETCIYAYEARNMPARGEEWPGEKSSERRRRKYEARKEKKRREHGETRGLTYVLGREISRAAAIGLSDVPALDRARSNLLRFLRIYGEAFLLKLSTDRFLRVLCSASLSTRSIRVLDRIEDEIGGRNFLERNDLNSKVSKSK